MSERTWTEPQKNAIDAQTGTLLVSAAAGSGKTAVLVERIVRLLTKKDGAVPPSALLVVTFTNAAAAEMRSRIYSRIASLMHAPGADRAHYSALLSHLDEMNVCTMDAFGIKLVRKYFYLCGVSSDFTMLDNGESKILKKQTAAEVVEEVFAEYPEKASSLAKLFQRGRTDEKLIDAIIDLSDFSVSEPEPEKWLDGVTAHFTSLSPDESEWGKIISDEVFDGIKDTTRLSRLCIDELQRVPELYHYKNVPLIFNGIKDACERAERLFPTLSWDEKRELINETFRALEALPRISTPKSYQNDPIKNACSFRRKTIKEYYEKEAPKQMCASSAEHADDVRRLRPDAELLIYAVKRFNAELLSRKRERNSYDFSDILHFVLGFLFNPEAPDGKTDTARELSSRFYEILIDEYQDTNRAQDMLFSCLSKNGNNLFTVGDVKQSIYRFRLASPEIFIEKSESYPPYDGSAVHSKIVLKNNFRSRKGVLASVNYTFGALMSKRCGEIEYNEDERLCPPPGTEDEPVTSDFAMHIVDGDKTEDEAEYTARLIAKMLADGTEVHTPSGVRRATYGDFCILLRSAKKNSALFSAALRHYGIPVSVEAKGGFFDSAEIRLATSLLHVIDNPSSDVHLLAVMMSPLFGFTPDDAARVRLETDGRVPEKTGLWGRVSLLAEENFELCRELRDSIRELRRDVSMKNAGQAVRAIFEKTGTVSVMGALTDGELRRGNLRQLIALAESYSVDPSRTLGAFVRYIDAMQENGASVKRVGGGSADSVRIMTMHGSKGLEFPFVIIAGTTGAFNDTDLSDVLVTEHTLGVGLKVREPSELKSYPTLSSTAVTLLKKRASRSEELRILYVAMTRAREKLIVVAASRLNKLAELNALSPTASPASPYTVMSQSNVFNWLLLAFMHHPDAYCLRQDNVEVIPSDFPAEIKLVSINGSGDFSEPDNARADADEELTNRLLDGMRLRYGYAEVASVLAKHTASTLHAERFSPEFFGEKLPGFLSKSGVSAVDIGTATHLFLQYCDFEAAKHDLAGEKARLVEKGRLTEEQSAYLDDEAVTAFFSCALAADIENADVVYREKRFTLAESICDADSGIPEKFRDEKTVIIGKIDLCFVKDGKAAVVDYKTDTVTDENALVNRYREQLSLYARAAEHVLGCPVSRCVLYSLKGRKAIEVPVTILK